MALITPTGLTVARLSYGGLTIKDTRTPVTPAGGGDFVQMVGDYLVFVFTTTGTASTITYDSVQPSDQGQDTNVTTVMGTTETAHVTFKCDNRFKQQVTNIGYLGLTYSSVAALTFTVFYLVAN
jgi:phosphosulfolactate synthase (CoM biosynthesis protein A)